MKCLCCGRDLPADHNTAGWHAACIKRFFGTRELPEIILNDETLTMLAVKTVEKGFTVTGVQKKLSLHLAEADRPRLTLVDYPSGYILKPQEADYPYMPESEQLVMCMADVSGIKTVPHALIVQDGGVSYITKRVDRVINRDKTAVKLAMEDFCQLGYKPAEEKYHGSYERCAKIISRYSSRAGFDMTELFMRLVFCFLTGNSDMHLKNFSLIETGAGSSEYILSPAYDLLPVQLILPGDTEDTALALNGKKQNLRRKDFIGFAAACGISEKTAGMMIARLIGFVPKWQMLCRESLLPRDRQDMLLELIDSRVKRLSVDF